MQRRQFLKSTSVALAATLSGCGGSESGVAAQSNTPASPAPAPAPPPAPGAAAAPTPPPAGRFLDVPSQLNEQQTYDSVLGWSWTASDKATNFPANPGAIGNQNITDDTEGDDLWSHYQAYKRTGLNVNLQWAQRWRDYFVNLYYPDWAAGDGQEHTYGQGLALWGMERNDSAALAALTQIATRIESMMPGAGAPMSYYGGRMHARRMIVACYQAHVNPIARWINLRDLYITRYMQASDWQQGGVIAAGGHYFCAPEHHTAYPEMGSYAAGYRTNSSHQFALITEALWRAYLQTARTDLRDRLVMMARYINHYCNNTALVNPFSGSWWGHSGTGGFNFARSNGGGSATTSNGNDPAYETSHVNSLVVGYKLTGEAAFLTKARGRFRTGTQYDDGGGSKYPDNLVHHYVDTLGDGFSFGYNKGELQYTYLIFENGGLPSVEA